MSKAVAFEKVSYEQFLSDLRAHIPAKSANSKMLYGNIRIPLRSTQYSAGYDFRAPCDIVLPVGSSVVIPTGIRCKMGNDSVLLLLPRSGHGFKYGLHLANSVGVIDAEVTIWDLVEYCVLSNVNGVEKM